MPLPFLSLISRCDDPIFVPRLKDGIRLDVNDEIIIYIFMSMAHCEVKG